MSQSKTDKIRERLEALRFRAEKYEHGATTFDVDRLLVALEPVVEECEATLENISYPGGQGAKASKIIDIIANELDVEEG